MKAQLFSVLVMSQAAFGSYSDYGATLHKADGSCRNFSDCIFGLFFEDPEVRILGRWRLSGTQTEMHFSPNGYLDIYKGGVRSGSGYWAAERTYPQFGKMDLNITTDNNGQKNTVLYLVSFSSNNQMKFTFQRRSARLGYEPTNKHFYWVRVQ
ncbi:hypothetical protein [Novosphingobium beihaiensis]|uniref:hypothetical protein n=1 Tax=Novosphingobium beihaiensis TaxID=2930389 RepID=UPI001FB8BCC1|nr:hypothetical protein [Novosphingobium beihaiensis]